MTRQSYDNNFNNIVLDVPSETLELRSMLLRKRFKRDQDNKN